MRKITEIESVFEKYGIVHKGNIALFNQTFFLHTDDVQAEAMTHKYVMSRAQNTEAYTTFTHLSGLHEFQKLVHMIAHISKGHGKDLHHPCDPALDEAFLDLLHKGYYWNDLHAHRLTVYGTPHKGTDTLKVDVPSDVEDPAAFMQKVQELYLTTRRNVACLNISASCESILGVDTTYRAVWILNRLLIEACKGSRDFVPGQVTLFTPYLTQVRTNSVQDQIDTVCNRLYLEWKLYAVDETFSQYLYRMANRRHHTVKGAGVVNERLAQNAESARRELCGLLEKPLTGDDFTDYAATWVLNHPKQSPNEHHRGLYWAVVDAHEFDGLPTPFLEWIKQTLAKPREKVESSPVTLAWDTHCVRYSTDKDLFVHHLEELHN